MAPRGQGRRKVGKSVTAGKNPGKKTTKSSTPSLTLNEILNTLNISFDKQLGILNGDLIHTVPSIPTLEQLRKLIAKLNDQLEIVSEHDQLSIKEFERLLAAEQTPDVEESRTEASVDAEDVQMGGVDIEEKKDNDDKNDSKVLAPLTSKDDIDIETDVKMEDVPAETVESDKDESRDEFSEALEFSDALERPVVDTHKRKLSVQEIENDPSVKNPKSEFVKPQTLPAAAHALGLFSEEDGGLATTGEEYLKKKYGVSSYPKSDLKDLLPGDIPDVDFSKTKPSNQVQFATFQSFIENFYRPFTEDDLKFLKNKYILPESLANDPNYDPNVTPYLIPVLGQLYSQLWNEEENSGNYSPPPSYITKDSILPKSSSTELTDEALEYEDISCGPLVSRLLSAVLKEDSSDNPNGQTEVDDDNTIDSKATTALPDQQGKPLSSVNTDYTTLEERLKRELKYIGIFMNLSNDGANDDDELEPDWLNPEDDEVSTELRRLQNELKTVSKRNNKRKKILQPLVENQLAWQQYNSILDDLEKQIDQTYVKRIKVPKNKKKKTGAVPPSLQAQLASQSAQQAAANSATKSLLDKRVRWINKIGPLFEREDGLNMKKHPVETVFDSVDLEEEEDDEIYEDGDDLVLQEQH